MVICGKHVGLECFSSIGLHFTHLEVGAGEEGASQCIEWLSTSRRPLSVALKLRPGALKLARAKGHVSTDEEKKKSAMFIPGPF